MLANNEVGTIEPVRELAAIAHAHGAPFHTDAVQAVGHIPVDVRELDVDALSLSAHKFHGPRGIGALYLREGFSIPPLIAGGAQERGERAGTENLAGIVGMATALEEACEHLAADMTRISTLRDLREGFSIPPLIAGGAQERGERAGTENLAGIVGMATALEEACEHLAADMTRISTLRDALIDHLLEHVDGIRLTGAPIAAGLDGLDHLLEHVDGIRLTGAPIAAGLDGRLPSIASFTCDDVDGELLVVLLDRAGVAAATGSACSTGSTEPSHVLTAMGIDATTAHGALRLSLASNVTDEDIALLSERIPTCIRKARLISSTR